MRKKTIKHVEALMKRWGLFQAGDEYISPAECVRLELQSNYWPFQSYWNGEQVSREEENLPLMKRIQKAQEKILGQLPKRNRRYIWPGVEKCIL